MRFLAYVLTLGLLLGWSQPSHGQGAAPGVANISFLRLYHGKNFSASVQLDMVDTAGKNIMTVENMSMLFRDGNFRADVDMSKIKGPSLTDEEMANIKQAGMDHASTIMRQDLKRLYIIYSGLKSYVDIDLPPATIINSGTDPKITKAPQGKETINGHPCTKNLVTFTDQQGKQEQLTVWEASDLGDMAVQVKMLEKDHSVVIQFKEIKMGAPDKAQFEAPAGYQRFSDIKTLMVEKIGVGGGK